MRKSPSREFSLQITRRRKLAIASTAIGLAGCGMLPTSSSGPTSTRSIDPKATEAQVKAFTADIELALDKVDRERLRAAAEKKPADTTAATKPAPASVILASAGAEDSHAPASHAPAAPAAHAPAPPPAAAAHAPAAAAHVDPHAPAAPAAAHTVPPAAETHAPVAGGNKPAEPASHAEVSHAPPAPAAEKAPAVSHSATEKPAAQGTVDISAVPMTSDAHTGNVPSSVISPVASGPATPAAAMGSMSALATAHEAGVGGILPSGAAGGEPSVEEAMAVLKKNVGVHPTLSTALALAILDGGSAAEASKGLSEADQKVFTDLLGALEVMKTASPAGTVSDRAAPLVDAARKWQADAKLMLPRMVLATRVDSFGVFTPVEPIFEQGKRRTVIIYCEVANFASQKGEDGWYSTHLTQQETLMTDDDMHLMVWRPNLEDVEDRSMNQRHDFYLVKKLTIPENLAAGKYTLVMNVSDKISNKKNIATINIEIK